MSASFPLEIEPPDSPEKQCCTEGIDGMIAINDENSQAAMILCALTSKQPICQPLPTSNLHLLPPSKSDTSNAELVSSESLDSTAVTSVELGVAVLQIQAGLLASNLLPLFQECGGRSLPPHIQEVLVTSGLSQFLNCEPSMGEPTFTRQITNGQPEPGSQQSTARTTVADVREAETMQGCSEQYAEKRRKKKRRAFQEIGRSLLQARAKDRDTLIICDDDTNEPGSDGKGLTNSDQNCTSQDLWVPPCHRDKANRTCARAEPLRELIWWERRMKRRAASREAKEKNARERENQSIHRQVNQRLAEMVAQIALCHEMEEVVGESDAEEYHWSSDEEQGQTKSKNRSKSPKRVLVCEAEPPSFDITEGTRQLNLDPKTVRCQDPDCSRAPDARCFGFCRQHHALKKAPAIPITLRETQSRLPASSSLLQQLPPHSLGSSKAAAIPSMPWNRNLKTLFRPQISYSMFGSPFPGGVSNLPRTCKYQNCTGPRIYAFEGQEATVCSTHRTSYMKEQKTMVCNAAECLYWKAYGFEGQDPWFCEVHKLTGMEKVYEIRCLFQGCKKWKLQSRAGFTISLYCQQHQPPKSSVSGTGTSHQYFGIQTLKKNLRGEHCGNTNQEQEEQEEQGTDEEYACNYSDNESEINFDLVEQQIALCSDPSYGTQTRLSKSPVKSSTDYCQHLGCARIATHGFNKAIYCPHHCVHLKDMKQLAFPLAEFEDEDNGPELPNNVHPDLLISVSRCRASSSLRGSQDFHPRSDSADFFELMQSTIDIEENSPMFDATSLQDFTVEFGPHGDFGTPELRFAASPAPQRANALFLAGGGDPLVLAPAAISVESHTSGNNQGLNSAASFLPTTSPKNYTPESTSSEKHTNESKLQDQQQQSSAPNKASERTDMDNGIPKFSGKKRRGKVKEKQLTNKNKVGRPRLVQDKESVQSVSTAQRSSAFNGKTFRKRKMHSKNTELEAQEDHDAEGVSWEEKFAMDFQRITTRRQAMYDSLAEKRKQGSEDTALSEENPVAKVVANTPPVQIVQDKQRHAKKRPRPVKSSLSTHQLLEQEQPIPQVLGKTLHTEKAWISPAADPKQGSEPSSDEFEAGKLPKQLQDESRDLAGGSGKSDSKEATSSEWTCTFCTLLNTSEAELCSACVTPRNAESIPTHILHLESSRLVRRSHRKRATVFKDLREDTLIPSEDMFEQHSESDKTYGDNLKDGSFSSESEEDINNHVGTAEATMAHMKENKPPKELPEESSPSDNTALPTDLNALEQTVTHKTSPLQEDEVTTLPNFPIGKRKRGRPPKLHRNTAEQEPAAILPVEPEKQQPQEVEKEPITSRLRTKRSWHTHWKPGDGSSKKRSPHIWKLNGPLPPATIIMKARPRDVRHTSRPKVKSAKLNPAQAQGKKVQTCRSSRCSKIATCGFSVPIYCREHHLKGMRAWEMDAVQQFWEQKEGQALSTIARQPPAKVPKAAQPVASTETFTPASSKSPASAETFAPKSSKSPASAETFAPTSSKSPVSFPKENEDFFLASPNFSQGRERGDSLDLLAMIGIGEELPSHSDSSLDLMEGLPQFPDTQDTFNSDQQRGLDPIYLADEFGGQRFVEMQRSKLIIPSKTSEIAHSKTMQRTTAKKSKNSIISPKLQDRLVVSNADLTSCLSQAFRPKSQPNICDLVAQKDNMKKCQDRNCAKMAAYGFLKPIYCEKHRIIGMKAWCISI